MQISAHFQRIFFGLDDRTLESALKQMPDDLMPAIKIDGVRGLHEPDFNAVDAMPKGDSRSGRTMTAFVSLCFGIREDRTPGRLLLFARGKSLAIRPAPRPEFSPK